MNRSFTVGVALASSALLAFSSVAVAATGSNSGPAPKGAGVPGASNISGWAVVNADGSLARGLNATGASHISVGAYEVDFNSKLTKCAFTATVGNAGSGNPTHLSIVVASRSGNIKGVFVEVQDFSGTLTDSPFHLNVTC
jgi:hypothetical protein